MCSRLATQIALAHLSSNPTPTGRTKTAGEVRFIKDKGSDSKEWGWATPAEQVRHLTDGYVFNSKKLKPLACTLRSALMALGHVTSAHSRFVKIKSSNISPDGKLGGVGYIAKISDMRRQLMNTIEALSAFTDTIYDELNAPHWNEAEDTLTPRDRETVQEIVEESEEIREDPEGWAQEEEATTSKTAAKVTQTPHSLIIHFTGPEIQALRKSASPLGQTLAKIASADKGRVLVALEKKAVLSPPRAGEPLEKWLEDSRRAIMDARTLEARGFKDKVLMYAWDLGWSYVETGQRYYLSQYKLLRDFAKHHGMLREVERDFQEGQDTRKEDT